MNSIPTETIESLKEFDSAIVVNVVVETLGVTQIGNELITK